MDKAFLKIVGINLLIFTTYTLVSKLYLQGWFFLAICLLMQTIVCLTMALSNEKTLPRGAFILSLLLILLIGIGICTHLFTESAKHW